jgi:hypothetical protein
MVAVLAFSFVVVNVLPALPRALDQHVWVYFRAPHEQELSDFSWRIKDLPGFEQRFPGKSAPEALAVGRQLAASGSRRVDAGSILQRARLIARFAKVADDATCAAFYKGSLTEVAFQSGLRNMTAEDRRAFNEVTLRAITAELNVDPIINVSEADATRAWQAVYASLPATDAQRLAGILASSPTSDTDAAWAFRVIYQSVERLPEPQNLGLARLLASY